MNARPTSRVRWFLVFWLLVLSAVAYLGRVNLSIAGAKLAEEFAISNIQLGFIFSAFLLGYALFQTPAGWLADRFGSRRVLTAGVLWWGVFRALTASISHRIANVVIALLLLRFLLGADEAISCYRRWQRGLQFRVAVEGNWPSRAFASMRAYRVT